MLRQADKKRLAHLAWILHRLLVSHNTALSLAILACVSRASCSPAAYAPAHSDHLSAPLLLNLPPITHNHGIAASKPIGQGTPKGRWRSYLIHVAMPGSSSSPPSDRSIGRDCHRESTSYLAKICESGNLISACLTATLSTTTRYSGSRLSLATRTPSVGLR